MSIDEIDLRILDMLSATGNSPMRSQVPSD
jgi:hypothetical protein